MRKRWRCSIAGVSRHARQPCRRHDSVRRSVPSMPRPRRRGAVAPSKWLGYRSVVANTSAANFGDVVKHAVLCEVIVCERPLRYLESHGGRLGHELADLVPGPGGVWDFLEVAPDHDVLNRSAYAASLRRDAGPRDDPGSYPGSILAIAERRPHLAVTGGCCGTDLAPRSDQRGLRRTVPKRSARVIALGPDPTAPYGVAP